MTLFAGVFAADPSRPIPVRLCRQLERAIARSDTNIDRRTFSGDHHFVAAVDIGAFAEEAIVEDESSVGILIGDALLTSNNLRLPRRRQAEMLLTTCSISSDVAVRQARGTYAFAALDLPRHRITLVTDHLGIRPVYYAFEDGLLIFASALRILEHLDELPLSPSQRGRAEAACFGYPLADRTVYREVKRLRPAEWLNFSSSGLTTQPYFDWRTASVSDSSQERERAAYDTFRKAVSLRLDNDRSAFAFLSGGLDSRAVVTSLVDEGAYVHALNFSPSGAQDEEYAGLFANALAGHCNLHVLGLADGTLPHWSSMAADAIATIRPALTVPPRRPRLIWSGDGGSVGLGHVYLTEEVIARSMRGGESAVAQALLDSNRWQLPWSIFHDDAAKRIREDILSAVVSELSRYTGNDPVQAPYLFLMCNDQHRHLDVLFEDIDLHQVEFQTPFFDTEFIKVVTTLPVADCLYHRAYMKWFEYFPKVARSAPWQTYPGHIPCPIPVPAGRGASYQWNPRKPGTRPRSVDYRRQARELLMYTLSPAFDKTLFRAQRVRVAAALYWLGLRDFDYLTRIVGVLTEKVGSGSSGDIK
jgi:hypothetical protein